MLTDKQHDRLQAAVRDHLARRFAEAAAVYEQLRTEAPDDFQVNHLLGVVRHQQGRAAEALPLLDRARRSMPRSAPTLMVLGLVLSALGRQLEAERVMGSALNLAPEDLEIWTNLGAVYSVVGKTSEAIACFRRVLDARPDYAPAWIGMGATLHVAGRSGEAIECHTRAIKLDPTAAQAFFSRGQSLQALQRHEEALRDFDRVLELDPEHTKVRSFRLYLLNFRDDMSREAVFAEHAAYGAAVESRSAAPPRAFANTPDPDRRLRVGFLSPDLRTHSLAYFIEPLLASLDRRAFEVVLYHDHFSVDGVTDRLRSHAALWRHFTGCSDDVVADAIRLDAPDVLIDLAGHTGFNRLEIFARRLAPVQMTYLGYPGTTGLRSIDTRLTDAVADPVGETDHLHTERLLRFAPTAWAFQPPRDAPEPTLPPGLRGEPITFGSFNAAAKASPATLEVWRRILEEVPSSRLLLKSSGMDIDRCRQRLAAAGLPIDRVQLLPMAPTIPEHLACYGRLDVALDPFPYNGTTTTCEALWMGVPVVALAGDRHAARVGASLLSAIGRPEWIAADSDAYVRIAAELAADTEGRCLLRTGLREAMRRSPLLDHDSQARRFGAAIRTCWQSWCREAVAAAAPSALLQPAGCDLP
jgi:predicted O-linked N-acetylglucosamine transferase (SPINDLY family)